MKDIFLVTGAAGFIGSHIVDAFISKGRRVRILIKKHSDTTNIGGHLERGAVEVVYGNLHDRATLARALKDCTFICNAAALTDLSAKLHDLINTNVIALDAMLEIASQMPLKRFVQISSISAFDKSHTIIDESTPLTPINNYDRSKLEGEEVALRYWREKRVPVTILEPSAVYGPRVRIGFSYLLEMLDSGRMRYPVNEHTKLNMLYVGDLIQAVEQAFEVPEACGERFVIGSEISHTYRYIVELAARELGIPAPEKHVPFSIAKCYAFIMQIASKLRGKKPALTVSYFDYITTDIILDISKAQRILGFVPRYSIEEGMSAMVKWYRENTSPSLKKRCTGS